MGHTESEEPGQTHTSMTIIIDGDIPLYSIAFSVEEPIDWGNDFWTLHSDMGMARDSFVIWMDKVLEDLASPEAGGCEEHNAVVALSDSSNWRKVLYPEYKENRATKRKPVVFKPLRSFIQKTYDTLVYRNLEADDVLGLVATPEDIMVSSDKDLLTVPGNHYNPMKAEEGVVHVTRDEAFRNHMMQTLTGDVTDNYKGCPGVGPKGAEKILAGLEVEEMWPAVLEKFEKAGLFKEEALVQSRIAHILHPSEYDVDTHEVRLWDPDFVLSGD